MFSLVVWVTLGVVSAVGAVRLNVRMKNRNSTLHQGAQAAALDHLRYGTPAKKAPGRAWFNIGYRRYGAYVNEVRQRAYKTAIKDAERLLREQQTAYTLARSPVSVAPAPMIPDSIARQIDISGGAEWPDWAYTEIENLGYGTLDRSVVDIDRSAQLTRLFADAALGSTRRWLRYEPQAASLPVGPLDVIQRVQGETVELLRRHAAMVATARGWAPTPTQMPVSDYFDALERVAAWLRVYGFFDALANLGSPAGNVVADGLVASVVHEPPGYRMTPDDLNPLLAASAGMDRLAVLVLFDAGDIDPLLLARANEHGVALFTLGTPGEMVPRNRPATALAAREGGTDRVPWPHPSGHERRTP